MSITKDDSLAIKGLAIIGMMMLHFWGYPSWIEPEYMYKGILLPNDIFIKAGQFGNVCVSLFTFLVGYGFFEVSSKWDDRKYRVKKTVTFLGDYWVYCALFWGIGLLVGEVLPDILMGVLSFWGVANEIGIPMCVPFAWYVGFYLVCILLYPVIRRILKQGIVISSIITIVTWVSLKALYSFVASADGINVFVSNFFRRFPTIFIVLAGYIFAKYKIFEKIKSIRKIGVQALIIIGYVSIILVIKLWLSTLMEDLLGLIYAIGIIFISLFINIKNIPALGKCLKILGKYSMGMWFVSGIFYLPSGRLQKIAFLGGGQSPVLILLWVCIISFLSSFLITNACNKVAKLVAKK